MILAKMIASGVFERFPDLKFVGTEVHTGWIPLLPRALRRVGPAQPAGLEPAAAAERVLPAQRLASSTSSTRWVRPTATTSGWATSCGAPTSRTPRSSWPVDYQLGREILERAGATPSEIERIMWRNAADIYKIPYDQPAKARAAA